VAQHAFITAHVGKPYSAVLHDIIELGLRRKMTLRNGFEGLEDEEDDAMDDQIKSKSGQQPPTTSSSSSSSGSSHNGTAAVSKTPHAATQSLEADALEPDSGRSGSNPPLTYALLSSTREEEEA
jgi:hypothetical protein